MSYCRWSDENFMCDVYVYAHVYGGYVTHVARSKPSIPPIPALPMSLLVSGRWDATTKRLVYPSRLAELRANVMLRVWMLSRRLHAWSVGVIPRRNLGLKYDGESFCDDTPAECAERLEWLRSHGYRVPQFAIDALRAELA